MILNRFDGPIDIVEDGTDCRRFLLLTEDIVQVVGGWSNRGKDVVLTVGDVVSEQSIE